MGQLAFAYKDLYPGFAGVETSTMAQPDADDQEALNEDRTAAEISDAKNPTTKSVLLAVLLIACLAALLGGTR